MHKLTQIPLSLRTNISDLPFSATYKHRTYNVLSLLAFALACYLCRCLQRANAV